MYTHVTGSFGNTLGHVYSHWERRSQRRAAVEEQPTPGFTIAIAREAGIEGSSIGREVGNCLSWPVYDHELLELIAKDMGLHARLLENLDERSVSGLRAAVKETLSGFSSAPVASEYTYARHLMEVLTALGALGECVIIGRGAGHLLLPSHTLRVRLIGPRAERIATLSRKLHVSHHEAERRMDNIDSQRRGFIERHFRKNPEDPSNYDLLVNAARFTHAECVDLIVEALHRLEARKPSEPPQYIGDSHAGALGLLAHGHAR
jgi:hypothetical protein